MHVHWGYRIETAIYQSVAALVFILGCIQLYAWRLPHNANSIKMMQKCFHPAAVVFGLLLSLWAIDHRSIYGIYNPKVVLFLTAALSWTKLMECILFFKEFLNVVVNPIEFPNFPTIGSNVIVVLSVLNVFLCLISCMLCALFDRLWLIGIEILYLTTAVGCLLAITASGLPLVMRGNKFHASANSTGTGAMSPERKRTQNKLIMTLVMMSITMLILIALAGWILSSRESTVSGILGGPVDMTKYRANPHLTLVGVMCLILGFDPLRLSWLPLSVSVEKAQRKSTAAKPSSTEKGSKHSQDRKMSNVLGGFTVQTEQQVTVPQPVLPLELNEIPQEPHRTSTEDIAVLKIQNV